MRIKLIGICLMLLVSCETGHQEYSIETFINTTSIGGASFSPDEKSILILIRIINIIPPTVFL